MYCTNCGDLVVKGHKFCCSCGIEIVELILEEKQRNKDLKRYIGDTKEYINNYIKKKTVFVNVEDFINNSKPLNFRKILIYITAIVAVINIAAGFMIAVVLFMLSLFICTYRYLKMNSKVYELSREIDIDDLTVFLRNNLSNLSFENWKRGNPAYFGMKDEELNIIEFIFQEKTIHRIEFKTGSNTYKIKIKDTTMKSFIKYGGQNSSALLYKNAYLVVPIVEAAIEYYINNES